MKKICFDFKFQLLKHAHQTLSQKEEAFLKTHASQCPSCKDFMKKTQFFSKQLENIPTFSIPTSYQTHPFQALSQELPVEQTKTFSFSSFWTKARKHFLETTVLVVLLILFSWFFPKIQSFFSQTPYARLQPYRLKYLVKNIQTPSQNNSFQNWEKHLKASLAQKKDDNKLSPSHPFHGKAQFSGEGPLQEISSIGKTDLWRLQLKTISPRELRLQIVKTLKTLGLETNFPQTQGVFVPGGIQFNFIAPKTLLPSLVKALKTLTLPNPDTEPNRQLASELNWYRTRTHAKTPKGFVRVMIWLSQV